MKKDTITSDKVNSNSNFATFYNTYYKRFVNYAYYYVNDFQAAEDITHDAILYYWENRNKVSPETDVLGYIMLTVKNKCLNYLKHLQVEAGYVTLHAGLHEWEIKSRIMTLEDEHYSAIFMSEIKRLVKQALRELPEQTRYIFEQYRFKSRSRKEIAEELGVSLQKIDYHINKANTHVHNTLKDYSPLALLIFQLFFD